MIATKSPRFNLATRIPVKKIPPYLIYEIMDGKPIYHKGYRDVVNGLKTFEEIMGASSLQSLIVAYLVIEIGKSINEDLYSILTNESGLHLDKKNNLSGDVLIFDNKILPIEAIDKHYASVPPKIAIEVDIDADTTEFTADEYIHKKTQKLFDFGVEKVIWVMTQTKKVLLATPNEDWLIVDWQKDIVVLDGIKINVGQYLKKKGSAFA
jgi:Uma2 family endonuclease